MLTAIIEAAKAFVRWMFFGSGQGITAAAVEIAIDRYRFLVHASMEGMDF